MKQRNLQSGCIRVAGDLLIKVYGKMILMFLILVTKRCYLLCNCMTSIFGN